MHPSKHVAPGHALIPATLSLIFMVGLSLIQAEDLIDLSDRASVEKSIPALIAHRGGVITSQTPECSLAAMELAANQGYAMVELDVQRSRDGEPILFHDRTLKEACDVNGTVADYSKRELLAIQYINSDQSIVDLDQALRLCRTLRLGVMLDLKTGQTDRAFLKRIDDLIVAHQLGTATVTITGTPEARDELKHVMPTLSAEQLAKVREGKIVDLKGFYWFGLPQNLTSEEAVRFRELGALVFPAINTFRYPKENHMGLAKRDIQRLLKAGVHGFQIDSIYQPLFAPEPDLNAK